jgi:ABC-2 type transport system permease protein
LLVVVGIRTFADETQHRTLSSTFTRRPSRQRVAAAKGLVASGIAIGFCLAVDAVTLPIIAIGLAARDLPMTYDLAATGGMLARVALAMVMLSALGVALGAAVRNRTVALVSAIVWFALGEDIVGALLHVGRYLPGAAVQGLVSNTSTPTHPAAVASTLVLVGYLTVAATTAALSLRRDLT